MNIYRLISNIKDVKSRECFRRINESRNQEERSKTTYASIDRELRQCKEHTFKMCNTSRTSKSCKAFGISLPKFKCYSKSTYWKAWSKSKNFLVLFSLFFMPFIVNNLTYFMLLDFSVIGYDLQAFNNIGVYR